MAARVGTAAALGLKDERLKNESLTKRLVAGYYNSSVTSEFVSAARKKEANYKVGELIYLNIPEKTLATVFNISPQEYESIKQR
jgi:hypothetical protein